MFGLGIESCCDGCYRDPRRDKNEDWDGVSSSWSERVKCFFSRDSKSRSVVLSGLQGLKKIGTQGGFDRCLVEFT